MSRSFAYFLIGLGIMLLMATLFGCVDRIPQKSMSWDQENLKKNDAGCPTAIYIVENGELILCPPM
jgi:hypothetical protein